MVDIDNSSAITTSGDRCQRHLRTDRSAAAVATAALPSPGTLGISETTGGVRCRHGRRLRRGRQPPADDVTITNSGAITTHGISSVGILAQSIGGSGGTGGLAHGYPAHRQRRHRQKAANAAVVGVAIGGGGGTGNSAGNVEVNNNAGGTSRPPASTRTASRRSRIGGGGGNGGLAIVSQVGVFSGTEEKAIEVSSMSRWRSAVPAATAASGGTVDITNTANDRRIGRRGYRHLRAVGRRRRRRGGGAHQCGRSGHRHSPIRFQPGSVQISVAIGGAGGDGNNGGAVTVDNDGAITTHGCGGYGIFAQSRWAAAAASAAEPTISPCCCTDSCTLPGACTAPHSDQEQLSSSA